MNGILIQVKPVTISYPSFLANLSHFGLLCVSGPDANAFLQGQLTCDVSETYAKHGTFGACCDPKGRMLASFFLWHQHDYYLLMPKNMLEITLAHFKKYVFRSKIDLRIADDLAVMEFSGALPALNSNVLCFQWRGSAHLLVSDHDTIQHLSSQLIAATIYDENHWEAFNIDQGMVWIRPETRGLLIPQMIHLQKMGGVSFKKGCYVGQEIVARTEHLGKLKRHLYQATINDNVTVKLGEALLTSDAQSIGIIVAVAQMAPDQYKILAVLQDQLLENLVAVYYQSVLVSDIKLISKA